MEDDILAIYLLLRNGDKDDDKPNLSIEERRRRSKKIPRIALTNHQQSAFMVMFRSGNDQALINCCAVDHPVFRELLAAFQPVFDLYTIDRQTGLIRKRTITNRGDSKGRP